MRVLAIGSVYPPHLLGGYEVIWRGVTHELERTGHASRVLVTGYRNPEVDPHTPDDPGVFRELGWYWEDHRWPPFTPRQRLALERENAEIFDRHVAEFRPEVIAWWPVGGMSLSLLERARRAGIPSVFFVLDYWPRYGPQHDLWTAMWSTRRWAPLAGLADRVTGLPTRVDPAASGRWVFCSEFMRQQAFDTDPRIPPERVAVLTPGIEQLYLEAPPESDAPDWQWRLLYLGRVVEQKGVHTAIDALAQLPPEATLEIVGSGDADYRRRLQQRADELGLIGRVRFVSQVDRAQTVAAYRSADVVLHPVVWHEPWGLVPLEAMACGRPVVATGRGGSADFLDDGVNSLLFTRGDPEALADAVRRLADDPGHRARIVAAGRNTAAAHTESRFNGAAVEQIAIAATAAGGR